MSLQQYFLVYPGPINVSLLTGVNVGAHAKGAFEGLCNFRILYFRSKCYVHAKTGRERFLKTNT